MTLKFFPLLILGGASSFCTPSKKHSVNAHCDSTAFSWCILLSSLSYTLCGRTKLWTYFNFPFAMLLPNICDFDAGAYDSEARKFAMFLHFSHTCICVRSPKMEGWWTWLVVAPWTIWQLHSPNLIPPKSFRYAFCLLPQLTSIIRNDGCIG